MVEMAMHANETNADTTLSPQTGPGMRESETTEDPATMNNTILLIEDDLRLQKLLENYLGSFGYALHAAAHPADGLRALDELNPALVILDVMLPDMNGFEVCRRIRQTSDVPVIMLTARGEVPDRVAGLEMGADDYMLKPFEPRELVARIQTVLRRTRQETRPHDTVHGRLKVDCASRSATLDGADLNLTSNEFNALALLVSQPGQVLDRDALLKELRGLDSDAFNRSVDITMSRLRQKLGDDPKNPTFIKTVWGEGYLFIPQTASQEDA